MEFTLYYNGALLGRNSATPEHRQTIRRSFHQQLAQLWKLERFASMTDYVAVPPKVDQFGQVNNLYLVEEFGGFKFAPLISNRIALCAKLDVTILRRQRPGRLLTSGDIDNQVKTLLDALSKPAQINQLPTGDVPRPDEIPFHCLLQDDSLVTALSVKTYQLLTPPVERGVNDVVVIVNVQTAVTRPILATVDFM